MRVVIQSVNRNSAIIEGTNPMDNKKGLSSSRWLQLFISFVVLIISVTCSRKESNSKQVDIDLENDLLGVEFLNDQIRGYSGHSEIAIFRSPSFSWPGERGRVYDLRLSRDSLFAQSKKFDNIPYAVYNIHQPLENGQWYWQHRDRISGWSAVKKFIIDSTSIDFVPISVDSLFQRITPHHPRLVTEIQTRNKLKDDAQGYTDTEIILQEVESIMNKTVPEWPSSSLDSIKKSILIEDLDDLALDFSKSLNLLTWSYVLTQDRDYYRVAKKWMTNASGWILEDSDSISPVARASIMESLAFAVDVFWVYFKKVERNRIIDQIAKQADFFYHLWINDLETKKYETNSWRIFIPKVFNASVVLVHEVPQAYDWLSYIYHLWLSKNPILGSTDGAWSGGVGDLEKNMQTLIHIPHKLSQLTGQDFFQHPWYTNFAQWLPYAFPVGSISDGFLISKRNEIPSIDEVAYTDALSKLTQQAHLQAYAIQVLRNWDKSVKSLSQDDSFRWFRIATGYEMNIPKLIDSQALEKDIIFREAGLAYLNSDVNSMENNINLAIKSSPLAGDSILWRNQNTFNLVHKGKPLIYGVSADSLQKRSEVDVPINKTNQILINDDNQLVSKGFYGYLPRFISGQSISYVLAKSVGVIDLHSKNNSSNQLINSEDKNRINLERHYLFIKPNVLLIYDIASAIDPVKWTWQLVSPNSLFSRDLHDGFELSIGTAKVNIRSFISSESENKIVRVGDIETDSNRVIDAENTKGVTQLLQIESKQATTNFRSLSIIQVIENDTDLLRLELGNNNLFSFGDWELFAELNPDHKPLIELNNLDGGVVFTSSSNAETNDNENEVGYARLSERINGEINNEQMVGDVYPSSLRNAIGNE